MLNSLRCSRTTFSRSKDQFSRVLKARDMEGTFSFNPPPDEGTFLPMRVNFLDIDISMFKRIHVDRSLTQIQSIEEARSIYENDRQNPQVLEYIAWWLLCANPCNDEAEKLLMNSAIGRDSLFLVTCKLDNKSQISRTLSPGSFWVTITSQKHNSD
jgi:hypothetical protein